MPKLVTIIYLCGCAYRVPIVTDTSKTELCVMQMQAATINCPECSQPQDDDWMDVHKRGNYDRTQRTG